MDKKKNFKFVVLFVYVLMIVVFMTLHAFSSAKPSTYSYLACSMIVLIIVFFARKVIVSVMNLFKKFWLFMSRIGFGKIKAHQDLIIQTTAITLTAMVLLFLSLK